MMSDCHVSAQYFSLSNNTVMIKILSNFPPNENNGVKFKRCPTVLGAPVGRRPLVVVETTRRTSPWTNGPSGWDQSWMMPWKGQKFGLHTVSTNTEVKDFNPVRV